MEKMRMESPDLTAQNIEKIYQTDFVVFDQTEQFVFRETHRTATLACNDFIRIISIQAIQPVEPDHLAHSIVSLKRHAASSDIVRHFDIACKHTGHGIAHIRTFNHCVAGLASLKVQVGLFQEL